MNNTTTTTDAEQRIAAALELAHRYGQIDGDHHRMWVIDQMVRALTGDGYAEWVRSYCDDSEHGPGAYEWDTGITP